MSHEDNPPPLSTIVKTIEYYIGGMLHRSQEGIDNSDKEMSTLTNDDTPIEKWFDMTERERLIADNAHHRAIRSVCADIERIIDGIDTLDDVKEDLK